MACFLRKESEVYGRKNWEFPGTVVPCFAARSTSSFPVIPVYPGVQIKEIGCWYRSFSSLVSRIISLCVSCLGDSLNFKSLLRAAWLSDSIKIGLGN